MRKIKRIELGAMSSIYGLRFYECKHFYDNKDGEERFNRLELSFNRLKQIGVVQRFNSTKKLQAWLNSPEGIAWYVAKLNEKYADSYTA